VTPVDRGIVVTVRRPGMRGGSEVVRIDADRDDVRVLLAAESFDITDRCRPLGPRPLDACSYAAQVLAAAADLAPHVDGLTDSSVRLHGDWPRTTLERTFRMRTYPGLLLRRRVPLFDELGRLAPPVHEAVQLIEDLDTDDLPPSAAARDGVLDL